MRKTLLVTTLVLISLLLIACTPEVDEITFICPTEPIQVGETIDINYTTKPAEDKIWVNFTVSENNIVSIDSSTATMTGGTPGYVEVKITAAVGGVHDTCGVVVVEKSSD